MMNKTLTEAAMLTAPRQFSHSLPNGSALESQLHLNVFQCVWHPHNVDGKCHNIEGDSDRQAQKNDGPSPRMTWLTGYAAHANNVSLAICFQKSNADPIQIASLRVNHN